MVSVETLTDRSVRNMGAVHPLVREKITEVIREAYSEGIRVQISSGYRSFARQRELYAQGRSAPGNVVTNAEPGESVHNYGLAVDYFLVSRDGTDSLWTVNNDWIRVAELAKAKGFDWGGDWTSFKDYPHLQLIEGHTWRDLYNGWRPSFWGDYEIGEASTQSNDGVLEIGEHGQKIERLQTRLNLLDYGLDVDGDYGPRTTAAVKDFQREHGLKVDGKYGPHTQQKLGEVIEMLEELKKRVEELEKTAQRKPDNPDALHEWGEEPWEWAKGNGVTDGTNPQKDITREEVVTMLYRQEVK